MWSLKHFWLSDLLVCFALQSQRINTIELLRPMQMGRLSPQLKLHNMQKVFSRSQRTSAEFVSLCHLQQISLIGLLYCCHVSVSCIFLNFNFVVTPTVWWVGGWCVAAMLGYRDSAAPPSNKSCVIWGKCVRPEVGASLCCQPGHLSAFVPVTSSAQAPTKREIVNSPKRPSEEIRAQCLLAMRMGMNLIRPSPTPEWEWWYLPFYGELCSIPFTSVFTCKYSCHH